MNDKALQNYWYLANKCRMARKDLYRDVLKSVIEEHKWRLKCIDTEMPREQLSYIPRQPLEPDDLSLDRYYHGETTYPE
jgi:hypothetical protein